MSIESDQNNYDRNNCGKRVSLIELYRKKFHQTYANSNVLYEWPLSFSGLQVACSQVRSTWFGSHRSNPRWQGFMIRDWLPNNLLLQWLEALRRSHQAHCKFSQISSLVKFLRSASDFNSIWFIWNQWKNKIKTCWIKVI